MISIFIKLLRIKPSGKLNQALHSEKGEEERLSRVNLKLGVLSEVVYNRFTEDAYLPQVVRTLFGFARWLASHSSRSVYVFMKPKRHCTSVVSAVTLLIGVEKKTWLKSHFLDRRDWQLPRLLSLTMLQLLDQPTCSSSSRGSPMLVADWIQSL